MAKKNKVILMGYIDKILNSKKNVIKMKIRKNENKFIYPIVEIKSNGTDELKEGQVISLNGQIRTAYNTKYYKCPNEYCQGSIRYNYFSTKIVTEEYSLLKDISHNPYLNQVILLGPVCREMMFKYIKGTKSPVGHAKYQLAIGRKIPDETDYPWIATYARQAEEDNNRIVVGSQVLIDGIIVTRNSIKKCQCESCGTLIELNEDIIEVQGNTVEYLNNCMF